MNNLLLRSFAIGAAALFVGCANQAPKKPVSRNVVWVTYVSPRNDLAANIDGINNSKAEHRRILIAGEASTHSGGVNRAVICESKTVCRHAAARDEIELKTTLQSPDEVRVVGIVSSQMARHLNYETQSGPPGTSRVHVRETLTIAPEIPLIAEGKTSQPFDKILKVGEQLEVQGAAGAKFILSIKTSKY